jgi:hypothetical protein
MENVIGNGQVAALAPTLHHGTYRRAIMAVLSADVFTPAERVRANHNVYECEDSTRLTRWVKNVRRVFAEREAALEQIPQQPQGLRLTDTTWNLRCANLAEKRELLAYAASQGVACGREVHANDLGLGWNERQGKLYSFPAEWAGRAAEGRPCELISAAQFRALVQAGGQAPAGRVTYATAAQTSEIHSLALHRAITKGERTKALLALPTLDTVRATVLIGELWAKVLHRSESDTAGQYASAFLTA